MAAGSLRRRPPRSLSALGVALLFASIALVGVPASARADCQGPDPDYLQVARNARTVVIGEVIRTGPGVTSSGYAGEFTLRVTDILRGHVGPLLIVHGLKNHACSGTVLVALHDVIALAIDGTDPHFLPYRISAVGVIRGQPYAGEEHLLTRRQALAAVGALPETDTAPVTPPDGRLASAAFVAIGVLLLLGAAALARRQPPAGG